MKQATRIARLPQRVRSPYRRAMPFSIPNIARSLVMALLLQACDGSERDSSGGDAGATRDAGEPASPPAMSDASRSPDGADASRSPVADAGAMSSERDAAGERDGALRDAASDTERGSLSERYPQDENIASDPAVLFHDGFESGWGRWDAPTADTSYLTLETSAAAAHAGSKFLRSTVTKADLDVTQYISSSTRVTFDRRVDEIYWRFYARFPELAPNPHHWVRMAAGDESFNGSGRANTVPAGDEGFWFDFDANNDDHFNFYAYWYKMRSGRCNDGSATPGCAGDQGSTYYYGNVFRPPRQQPFPRDRWFCIEIHAKANTVGTRDGELSFWIDDQLVGDYRPGHPEGTWLRAEFHTGGCTFAACTAPEPFAGFDFRSAEDVGFKSIFLDAYYERDSSANKREALEGRGLTVSDEQTILYDDVVVATERIGCAR